MRSKLRLYANMCIYTLCQCHQQNVYSNTMVEGIYYYTDNLHIKHDLLYLTVINLTH